MSINYIDVRLIQKWYKLNNDTNQIDFKIQIHHIFFSFWCLYDEREVLNWKSMNSLYSKSVSFWLLLYNQFQKLVNPNCSSFILYERAYMWIINNQALQFNKQSSLWLICWRICNLEIRQQFNHSKTVNWNKNTRKQKRIEITHTII